MGLVDDWVMRVRDERSAAQQIGTVHLHWWAWIAFVQTCACSHGAANLLKWQFWSYPTRASFFFLLEHLYRYPTMSFSPFI